MTASTPDALWASRSVRQLRPSAVLCHGLRRRIGGARLLDGVDLAVPVGGRVVVVSHPEASASLLLRVLAGLSRSDGGTTRLAGLASPDEDARGWARRVAYVGPEPALPAWMSAREALDLAGRLLGYDRAERARRSEAAITRFGLARGAGPDRPIRRGGAALGQRLALATALVGEPEVLLLDEPLRALEPVERSRLLTSHMGRTTLLLASRFPASEAGIVRSVAYLRDGRVALHAPVTALERAGLPLSLRGIEALAGPMPVAT